MSFLDNQSIMLSFQKYTDKHRDNIPALLTSMWYCGSFCCAIMWRYALPEIIEHRLGMKKMIKPRLYWVTYFWMLEAVFGLMACRSVNYTAEELRGKTTSDSAMMTMKAFAIFRDVFANSLLVTVSTPWRLNADPRWIVPAVTVLTCLFGRMFSTVVLILFIYTIRSMIWNTRAYQGQEGLGVLYRGFIISCAVYIGAFVFNDAQLCVGFCLLIWCTVKILVQSFWLVDEYYWKKHSDYDHPIQNKIYEQLQFSKNEKKE